MKLDDNSIHRCFVTVAALIFALLPSSLKLTSAQSVDCDFTAGNLCGWIVDSQDQLHLQIMQEEQPPPELKTSGAFDSDYIYVTMGQMATKNRGQSKMRLISPYFETAPFDQVNGGQSLPATRCFSFWYRSASWKRSIAASFSFGLQSGADFFSQEIQPENANVWRYKQIDLIFKKPTDQIRLVIDGGDTYFSYVAFDHFLLASRSCEDSQHVIDRYRMLGGNCPGEYLAQYGDPIGCYKCSLAECMQTCEAYAFCRGVSWVDRKALNEAAPGNSQCYLKAASCGNDVTKHHGGYKFYERITGFSLQLNVSNIGNAGQSSLSNHNFQVLSSLKPLPAPQQPGLNSGEMSKWLPRNAKENVEFENIVRWQKPTTTPPHLPRTSTWLTPDEKRFKEFMTSLKVDSETDPTYTPDLGFFTETTTEQPTMTTESPSTHSMSTTQAFSSSTYSLVASPFPNSKHLYGYVPLQPFGNCGGHFIIDENHQYLGCTRCSFAQCATLCSLSEQCRGFSFTESILVAKQCYLKTALTCEPQPSSTGFKYFIKVKKSTEEMQVAEASMGRNGIGAFTIKPVMPRQTPNSEQESREKSTPFLDSEIITEEPTPAPWLGQQNAQTVDWSQTNMRYVALSGNCAGAFLRDSSGEAVTCPRCSLAACQKLCDQDDECRGISYSQDHSVAVQCYLKTVDNCSPMSETSGYLFHAKKD